MNESCEQMQTATAIALLTTDDPPAPARLSVAHRPSPRPPVPARLAAPVLRPSSTPASAVRLLLVLGTLATLASTAAAQAPLKIEKIDVGFAGNYKAGDWAPVWVSVAAGPQPFQGVFELSNPDGDDVPTLYRRPEEVYVAPGQTERLLGYVRPGNLGSDVEVRLISADGQVYRRVFQPGPDFPVALRQDQRLYVVVGSHPDIEGAYQRPGYAEMSHVVAAINAADQLPARWYGYDGVDRLLLTTANSEYLARLDGARLAAIQQWVKLGGHMIVSAAGSWQQVPQPVKEALAEMMPARLNGLRPIRQLRTLESYAESTTPLATTDRMMIAKLEDVRGIALVAEEAGAIPLVVQGAYGFGTVTLIGIDVEVAPLATWPGRHNFWARLLELPRTGADQQATAVPAALSRSFVGDLSSQLRDLLNRFEGVRLVPFGWVAFFIFIYILLIGPVDYWLLKKVFGRLELTWISFPLTVLVVSAVAFVAAYWLKGGELRLNKVDIVDVDATTGFARGTTCFTLFSPRLARYNLALQPQPPTLAAKGADAARPHSLLTWLGLPEMGIGGLHRQGGMSLFQRSYRYGPDAATLEAVPLQVWSTKNFLGRWWGQAGQVIQSDLEAAGAGRGHLYGHLTNTSDLPLDDCVVAYGPHAYVLGSRQPDGHYRLPLGAEVEFPPPPERRRELIGYLTGQRMTAEVNAAPSGQEGRAPADASLAGVIRSMMFYHKIEKQSGLRDDYLSFLDLSRHLDLGRAVLLAQVSRPGADLRLVAGGQPVEVDKNNTQTFLRVILPVKPSTAAER